MSTDNNINIDHEKQIEAVKKKISTAADVQSFAQ